MKTLWTIYYKLALKGSYDNTLSAARRTSQNIVQSTAGKVNHFHNHDGVQIRGWKNKPIRFSTVLIKHPLELKYN